MLRCKGLQKESKQLNEFDKCYKIRSLSNQYIIQSTSCIIWI